MSDEKKQKDGISVREIESFAKKHRLEVFFCVAFILACFFTFVMWGAAWSIIAITVGGILGVLFSGKVQHFSQTVFRFLFRQEPSTQLVLAIVSWILAIFIPPLVFLLLGLHGGKDMHHIASEIYSQHKR